MRTLSSLIAVLALGTLLSNPASAAPRALVLESARSEAAELPETDSLSCWIKIVFERQDGSEVIVHEERLDPQDLSSDLTSRFMVDYPAPTGMKWSIQLGCSL